MADDRNAPKTTMPDPASSALDESKMIVRFMSLQLALKELRPCILNGEHLRTRKPLKRFDQLRSRELVANLLIYLAVNSLRPIRAERSH